jgi:hypothetical protein
MQNLGMEQEISAPVYRHLQAAYLGKCEKEKTLILCLGFA